MHFFLVDQHVHTQAKTDLYTLTAPTVTAVGFYPQAHELPRVT